MRKAIGLWMLWAAAAGLLGTNVAAQEMAHPESIAGRWEAADGRGGMVGMNIQITTAISPEVGTLEGARQELEDLQVGVYARSQGKDVDELGFRFLSNSRGGGVSWDRDHLLLDGPEGLHARLLFDSAAETWTGSMERGGIALDPITLRRPTGDGASRWVGTWVSVDVSISKCVHIAQAGDGTYTGWSDNLLDPGRIRWAPGHARTNPWLETYGAMAKVQVGEDVMAAELWAYTAGCCSHPFTARLSADGRFLEGSPLPGGNPLPAARWQRVEGDSCAKAVSRQTSKYR